MALRGGSDFVPYAGMSFSLHDGNNTPEQIPDAKALQEHMHHPPDEEQRHDAEDCVRDPVAGGFGLAEVEHPAILALGGSLKNRITHSSCPVARRPDYVAAPLLGQSRPSARRQPPTS
jgi:hypothetical protein